MTTRLKNLITFIKNQILRRNDNSSKIIMKRNDKK